jgi:hypothetical protein
VEEVRLWKRGRPYPLTEAVEIRFEAPSFCVGKALVSLWRKCDSRSLGLVHAGWCTAEPQSQTWCWLTHPVGALLRQTKKRAARPSARRGFAWSQAG